MRIDSRWKRRGNGSTALAAPLRAGAIGPDLIEAFVFEPAPAGGGAATWFTPAAPFQVTPNTAPDQYYAATLAWSHRFTEGQLDFPRVSNRMFVSNGGFLDLQGVDDSAGLNLLGQLVSWAYATLGMTMTVSNLVNPGVNHNYVMLWNVAGLPSGNEAELWQDGVMVGYANGTISDVSLRNLTLLGEGANVTAGETQGFWWSNDTAVPAATVFAELFDGANGMLDLNADPTVGGVTPDNYYIEPGSGPSGITGTASGTADVTGSAAASARTTASVSGSADVTGASSGTLRAFATIAGTADVTGTATATAGPTSIIGTASGTADVTGAASGTLRAAATVSGTADTTGASAGTLRASVTVIGVADTTGAATVSARTTATATGTADTTGTATVASRTTASVTGGASVVGASTGTLRATATASGSVGVSGAATGNVETGSNIATASGVADVTGTATATVAALTATVAGVADVTGQATSTAYATRNILVWGTWPDHSYLGHWPDNTAIGTWRAPKAAGAHREIIVQGRWA